MVEAESRNLVALGQTQWFQISCSSDRFYEGQNISVQTPKEGLLENVSIMNIYPDCTVLVQNDKVKCVIDLEYVQKIYSSGHTLLA